MLIWLFAFAFAQEPPEGWTELQPAPVQAEPAPQGEADDVDFQMLIVGEHVVAARRDKVIRKMEELGYTAKERSDGTVVFRPPSAWMGRGRLWKTGDITFTMPVLAYRETGPPPQLPDRVKERIGLPPPLEAAAKFDLPTRDEQRQIQDAVRAEVMPELEGYREALRLRGFGLYLQTLPDRFAALWDNGVGLDQGSVPTWEGRRAELLDLWSSRTETPEGRATCRVIESFLRNVVQDSEHPLTPEEIAAAEAKRTDGRKLDVDVRR